MNSYIILGYLGVCFGFVVVLCLNIRLSRKIERLEEENKKLKRGNYLLEKSILISSRDID